MNPLIVPRKLDRNPSSPHTIMSQTESETRDHVSINIDNLIRRLPSSPPKPTIFRVDEDFRYGNDKLYDPKIVSIGPLHYRKDHLQELQQHKLMYINCLLKRLNESTVHRYVTALRPHEEKARKCYHGPINLNPDEFVEMLLIDGLLIIELVRKYNFEELREQYDAIFQHRPMLAQLRHDLMLVENQIPFIIVDQLFEMTKSENPEDEVVYLVRLFTNCASLWPKPFPFMPSISSKDADHFLGLVHEIWCSPFANLMANRPFKTKEDQITVINPAIELQESGVQFKKYSERNCFDINCFDISFARGVLRIPAFIVSDYTESILGNLMAYERTFINNNHPKYVTHYAFFLNCLLSSSKDVEILRRSEILTNLMGNDKMVCDMFNRLSRNALVSPYEFCYADIYKMVKGHCGHRRNRWVAILRRTFMGR